MVGTYYRHKLKKRSTGECITIKHEGAKSLSPLEDEKGLFQSDLFGIERAILHADETQFERVGDVEIWGPTQ